MTDMERKLERLDALVKKSGLSRREFFKLVGAGGVGAMAGGIPVSAEAGPSSDKKIKLLIVGGGAGGIMALARLRRALPEADITIVAPNVTHLYQPGQVFVAAGLYQPKDLVKPNRDFIPENVHWVKDEVESFLPEENHVVTRSGKKIGYDYMVVATGIVERFDMIEGFEAKDIGTHGIANVYHNNFIDATIPGAVATWKWFNALKEASASGKKPTAVYTSRQLPSSAAAHPRRSSTSAPTTSKRRVWAPTTSSPPTGANSSACLPSKRR